MLVSLITPTGGRCEAFRLCERWVRRQTYTGEMQWVVVDDCDPETTIWSNPDEIIRPVPRWSPLGGPTIRRNLLTALDAATGDVVLIIEDDDWYSPWYVDLMLDRLRFGPLVGETNSPYYNVRTRRYHTHLNRRHSSLFQTGFTREVLPSVRRAIEDEDTPFVDLRIWAALENIGLLFAPEMSAVGIKGLPGRGGIGAGHRGACRMSDPDLQTLTEWIGDDAEVYAHYKELA